MKNIMHKKISIGTLLTVVLIMAFSITAMGAAVTTIQATLSPDVTVKYNGEVQVMKDGNGKVVYPIVYEGTTYLPVRAVANMFGLPVEWQADTKTVVLGAEKQDAQSFLKAASKGKNCHPYWSSITGESNLPQPADKSVTYTEAIYQTPINMMGWKGEYDITGNWSELSFTFYSLNTAEKLVGNTDEKYTLYVINNATGEKILERTVANGVFVDISVDITGISSVTFQIVSTFSWANSQGPGYILNPILK